MSSTRVFLSHSSKDKEFVRRLAKSLRSLGIAPWFDEVEIKPGDSLFGKIGEGLASSDYLFAVMSANSIASRWVDEELRSMMNVQLKSGQVRVIPIKIDDAEMPWFLTEKKYVDFRGWQLDGSYRHAFDGLVQSFCWIPTVKCKKTGLEFVKIEEGVFKFGPHKSSEYLPTFWISRFVLNANNMLAFLKDVPMWQEKSFSFDAGKIIKQIHEGAGNYPAQFVTIAIGMAFANWAGLQLPSQRQWEKAARGRDRKSVV